MEATPWSNQLDLIVGALPNRAGATYTPNSIWSSATQSNQLGRGANAATERNDPLLPFQFNNRWGSLDANVDDDQSWASASSTNELGRRGKYY